MRDTGVGIAAAMLPRIFDLFTQVPGQSERSEGGLGIGLSLVRNLIDRHGGSVQATSAGLGQGSEFVVRLPLFRRAPPPAPTARTTPELTAEGPSRRILVIDDNRESADAMAMLLRVFGHDVRTAYDGPTALDMAREQSPDVVLCDVSMPGMSGLEVARRLRQDLGLRDLLMVALTGYGEEEDKRRSEEAGFNAHMVKPINLDVLQALLSRANFAGPSSSLEAPVRIRSAGGFPLNLDPLAFGEGLDRDGGFDRIDRCRGRGPVLRDVPIQAGEGTEALPAPGAKDGVPQPPAALLTVTEDRHGFSKVSLMSRYTQSRCHKEVFVSRPVEGVTRRAREFACYSGTRRYDEYWSRVIF